MLTLLARTPGSRSCFPTVDVQCSLKYRRKLVEYVHVVEFSSLALNTGSAGRHDHFVEFYDTEIFLADTVCSFIRPALGDGGVALVVATLPHRRMFEAALGAAKVDVVAAARQGNYLAMDAADLLTRFMVDERPDPGRFREAVGTIVDLASRGGRQVHVYGEMVALLLAGDNVASALALEDLWNDLAESREFRLLCAYPTRAFDHEDATAAFNRICEQHTVVIPSEGYSLLEHPAERSRVVAQLQQQTGALQAEIRRLREQAEENESGAPPADGRSHQRDEAGDQRDQAGAQRDEAGVQRDEAGVRRDQAGDVRDQAADQRDHAADERDEAATRRDQAAVKSESTVTTGTTRGSFDRSARARSEAASDRRRASQDRRAGARERIQAERDRGTALADRGAGASERTEAELDRDTALADRGASAKDREALSHDDLTHAYLRGAGFVELEREIARARKANQPLVVAFVDVDHLKDVNDSKGHAAGDRMLLEVANTLRAKLRLGDLIIRYGGDEFVCAISGVKAAEATKRLALINAALADAPECGSVTVGVAEMRPNESCDDLVARADAALYRQRQRSTRGCSSPRRVATTSP